MSSQGVDSTTEVDATAFGGSKRPQRTRKTTKFYTPVPSPPKKKRKVTETAGSKRKLDPVGDEEPRKLIKVCPVPGKKHVQQGRCFSGF